MKLPHFCMLIEIHKIQYLKKELMELTDFLHAGTISHKNGYGHGQKWAWSKMGVVSLVMGL